MAIEFYLHAGPPPREVIEKTRERMERWFPLVALGLGADALLCGIMVLKLRGRPGQETILECGLLALGLLALVLIWQLAKIISGLMKLNEAHPSTAHAYLECASRETVRSYSRAVIRQGRYMTMAEADMLLKHCTTPEEIARLADYLRPARPSRHLLFVLVSGPVCRQRASSLTLPDYLPPLSVHWWISMVA